MNIYKKILAKIRYETTQIMNDKNLHVKYGDIEKA